MDRDFILELFSEFRPVTLRRMFSGYGAMADGVNFAMVLRGGMIFRVDEQTVAKYQAEGTKPFQYDTKSKTVVVKSYWHLPERLYDDPEELAIWAREAVGAAHRAAAKKPNKRKSAKAVAKTPKAARKAATPKTKSKKTLRKKRQAT
jgi:DNA transformation protein and related proteins